MEVDNVNNFVSRVEIEEICDGLIQLYFKQKNLNLQCIKCIDIEDFIKNFLRLKIQYVSFAEEDGGKIGFLSDGVTPLMINQDGAVIPCTFAKGTVVLERYLLRESEYAKRRFTLAHEAAHYILEKQRLAECSSHFHSEYDAERTYSKEDLSKMFASAEWQADTMAASLLMPRFLMQAGFEKYANSKAIAVYGGTLFAPDDKKRIKDLSNNLGVSFTSLVIRLRTLNMLEYHNTEEYIIDKLQLGGNS